MTIVIEFDRCFTIGFDTGKKLFGIRLGFIGIHVVFADSDSFFRAVASVYNKGLD